MSHSIPKVIHFCWFGRRPKTQLAKKCIASWRRFCPDWEIKEWNESNWDVGRFPFATETAARGLWAFVSDVARWDILHREGGVFFDVDVELVKPIDDLCMTDWVAAECDDPVRVNPGLGMAISKGSTFAAAQLELYSNLQFDPSRKFDFSSPWIVSRLLDRPDAPRVLPNVYFNPRGGSGGRVPKRLDARTYGIHHYAGSWWSLKSKLVYTMLPRMGIDVGTLVRWLRR